MKHQLLIEYCCSVLLICTTVGTVVGDEVSGQEKPAVPFGVMEPARVAVAYTGSETFRYEIAYTGGLKLGELQLEVRPVAGMAANYELYTLVTTEGSVFNSIYPVRDIHITRVSGPARLPYSYEVWQKEGYRYQAHKITQYDQVGGGIRYQRNESEPVIYEVMAPIHNEFSSFFASRLMSFDVGGSFLVPTFADKKRVDVEVKVLEKVHLKETALGPVDAFRVSPILKFKGLYDKRGDTVIWYTDDECRVPVKITSKLAIGSITATLMSYENPVCSKYAPAAGQDNSGTQDILQKNKIRL